MGSPEERSQAGLRPDALGALPRDEARQVEEHFQQAVIVEGGSADLIAAVAEDVKLSHLDTHINRLLVLRPQIDDVERVAALVDVFRFLGDGYDFRFDVADASRHVCTEVVYRAYHGRGAIRYTLTERAGHPTLSADDIIIAAVGPAADAYEVILFADEDPDGLDHAARVLEGRAAGRALVELLRSSGSGESS